MLLGLQCLMLHTAILDHLFVYFNVYLKYSLMLNWPPVVVIRKVRFLKTFYCHNSVTAHQTSHWKVYTEFLLNWLRDNLVMTLESSVCGLFRMIGLFRTREYIYRHRQTCKTKHKCLSTWLLIYLKRIIAGVTVNYLRRLIAI